MHRRAGPGRSPLEHAGSCEARPMGNEGCAGGPSMNRLHSGITGVRLVSTSFCAAIMTLMLGAEANAAGLVPTWTAATTLRAEPSTNLRKATSRSSHAMPLTSSSDSRKAILRRSPWGPASREVATTATSSSASMRNSACHRAASPVPWRNKPEQSGCAASTRTRPTAQELVWSWREPSSASRPTIACHRGAPTDRS